MRKNFHITRASFGAALRLHSLLPSGYVIPRTVPAAADMAGDTVESRPETKEQAEFNEWIEGLQGADEEPPVVPRKRKSRARTEVHCCLICGSHEHNAATCPNADGTVPMSEERRLVAAEHAKAGKEAAALSHKKYVPEHQRTHEYVSGPSKLMDCPNSLPFVTLCRMTPFALCESLIESDFLENLAGKSCWHPKCGEKPAFVKNAAKKLSKLKGHTSKRYQEGTDICVELVCYRCDWCGTRVGATHGHPMFESIGHGGYGPSYQIMAWHKAVYGHSLTDIVLDLGVSEGTAREWMHQAMSIMAEDALLRQTKIVFGGLGGSLTCHIEADESAFFHWREYGHHVGEPDVPTHFWYVWVGIRQRGDPTKLWLAEVGVTKSEREARVPPLSHDFWKRCLCQAFTPETRAVLMTDSAGAYADVPHEGIVDKHSVNHQEHEYTRSVSVLHDTVTRDEIPGMAGTQNIDQEWRILKRSLPERGIRGRTEKDREHFRILVRAGQWQRIIGMVDRWEAFCQAVKRHREGQP